MEINYCKVEAVNDRVANWNPYEPQNMIRVNYFCKPGPHEPKQVLGLKELCTERTVLEFASLEV